MEDVDNFDYPSTAKVLVMIEFARLIKEGRAVMATLEAGTFEIRLTTGEIFHLGEETITRVV